MVIAVGAVGYFEACEENWNLYRNIAQGTTVEAQGTTAIAMGAVGYFKSFLNSSQAPFSSLRPPSVNIPSVLKTPTHKMVRFPKGFP